MSNASLFFVCQINIREKRENIRELEVYKKHASFECVHRVEHALQVRRISIQDQIAVTVVCSYHFRSKLDLRSFN
jgi:hypothetical protein